MKQWIPVLQAAPPSSHHPRKNKRQESNLQQKVPRVGYFSSLQIQTKPSKFLIWRRCHASCEFVQCVCSILSVVFKQSPSWYRICLQANEDLQRRLLELQNKTVRSPPASASSAKGSAPTKSKPAHRPQKDSDRNESEEEESQEEQPTLSEGAKLGRLRRLRERKPSGKLRVPDTVHDMWKQGGHSRSQLLKMLEDAEWNEDPCTDIKLVFAYCNALLCFPSFLQCLSASFAGSFRCQSHPLQRDHHTKENSKTPCLVHSWAHENKTWLEQVPCFKNHLPTVPIWISRSCSSSAAPTKPYDDTNIALSKVLHW